MQVAAVQAESIDTLFARYGPVYKWLATMTCMLGGMTAILASSTVNVAFPDIMGAFGIGRDQYAAVDHVVEAAQRHESTPGVDPEARAVARNGVRHQSHPLPITPSNPA